ncbi:MAG TPA: GspH/FimT family pseudopilin [Candidatus Polarisedimenticolia bacterium]|nr:GspH/FimT family pseudopilin [Candidatus Polarisedimenticolia bacterium]
MRHEQGMSLAEISIVLALAAIVITVAVTYALPWIGREEMRGAVYQVQTHLQLARIQAVTRNRSCRFVIDGASGRVQVFDLVDPASATDDIQLADLTLPSTVAFSRPDSGSAITLTAGSGTQYLATFAADGSVSDAAGEIVLKGGDRYDKVTLYGAGGIRVEHWDGSAWTVGS